MKKTILTVIAALLFTLAIPLILLIVGITAPSPYGESYYGELSLMYENLKNTSKNKIVIIGNSGVAFGVDSQLIEEELSFDGKDYSVCNFGLYGSIGTKTMLDLSRRYIKAGDIVIFAPEINEQALSLYFSPLETWRGIDGNWRMFSDLQTENISGMVGTFPAFTAEKYAFLSEEKGVAAQGVYAASSFNERCDMKNAEREYNVMLGGYDINNPISLDSDLFSEEFCSYVNGYYAYIKKAGAEMYFSFAPMNGKAVMDKSADTVRRFYVDVAEKFDFPLIGDPNTAIMDSEWFYDSNLHLNTAGMIVHTLDLIEDIKNLFEITSSLQTAKPEKPQAPQGGIVETNGNNLDADCFIYEDCDEGVKIIGLTEAGKEKSTLVVPVSYEGKSVLYFEAAVFAGNKNITEITLQENIRMIRDRSFNGCDSLKKLILLQTDPEKILPGYELLYGAEHCSVYIEQNSLRAYIFNYLWSGYSSFFKTY